VALARAAFRTRAAQLVVATTGSASLSATATGYARSSGSFITDGFVVGQDVTPTGFTQTTVGVITAVTATTLTIDGGRTVQTAGSGRTLVSGIPTLRALQNTNFTPTANRPYIVEAFPLGGSSNKTIPGRTGRFQQDGLSVWTWYGVAGTDTAAIDKGVSALMARFSPFTSLSLSDGTDIDMRGDVGPTCSDIVNEPGWARCTVTLPWRASTRNAVLV
jgi:hypothetical protein